jgi:hypothetical protein
MRSFITYASPNKIRVIKSRRMKCAGNAERMRQIRNAHKILDGKPEEKRPLGRPRCRWENNITTYLGEIGWGGGEVWSGFIRLRTGANGKIL